MRIKRVISVRIPYFIHFYHVYTFSQTHLAQFPKTATVHSTQYSRLSTGFTVCILIFYYVQDELKYDQFHTHKDRIYRINQTNIWSDEPAPFASTGPNVALAIKDAIPEVESVIRIHTPGEMWGSYVGKEMKKTFQEDQILAADTELFKVFSTEFITGNPGNALTEPYSIILTETTAERYFGKQEALGKLITLKQGNEEHAFQVKRVVKDWPSQSHFHFDMLMSMSSVPNLEERTLSWNLALSLP